MFATRKRHILVRNRMFWRILRQNLSTALGCSELQVPKKTNTFVVRKVTHAQKRYAWANRDELLHRCRSPRRNHLCQILWLSLLGFERGGGSNFGFLHWLALSPLQHSRTTVRVCDSFGLDTRLSTRLLSCQSQLRPPLFHVGHFLFFSRVRTTTSFQFQGRH